MDGDSGKNPQREERVGAGGLEGLFAFLSQLHALGVRTAVLCPGGRNAPMVQALENIAVDWGWELMTFVDERAAGFFALARAKRDRRPVLVSVTSGTAAAELLPAAIEAQASHVPLILASADRPRHHRGSGSPQSMVQVGLYASFAPTVVDWQEGEEFPDWSDQWDQRSPVHINLCHAEPLWRAGSVTAPAHPRKAQPKAAWPALMSDFPRFKQPLLLVGALAEEEVEAVEAFCRWYQAPVLAEASSGLREAKLPNLLLSGDRVLRRWLKKDEFDGVIRLGGVPSWRLWRDLESWPHPVLSFGRTQWSGLPGRVLASGELAPWLTRWQAEGPRGQLRVELLQEDRLVAEKREGLLLEYPKSEAALVRQLSIHAAPDALVYLGNSRPVRDWNEHALFTKRFEIQENRGLNGIDGQVSSFYGHCRPLVENWALIGDLTALYDLQGPWALRHLPPETRTRLVVMNNGGGQIFAPMFPSPTFLNSHQLNFEGLAKMWGLAYAQQLHVSAQHALIELTPDAEETRALRERWSRL